MVMMLLDKVLCNVFPANLLQAWELLAGISVSMLIMVGIEFGVQAFKFQLEAQIYKSSRSSSSPTVNSGEYKCNKTRSYTQHSPQ